MKRANQGNYSIYQSNNEEVRAFIPNPLPPNPPINWTPELSIKFEKATLVLGSLDAISKRIPNLSIFLYMYARKEAVLSSMIEGSRASISDLLLFEIGQKAKTPTDEIQEVSKHVEALYRGLGLLDEGLPICSRLIREMHGVLLSGRSNLQPGEFRQSQNWIGGTRPGNAVFVPPPAYQVVNCIGELECFLNNQPTPIPTLLKVALTHVQFELIHPFLDGNGRIGRLLIPLILCQEKVISKPLLYPSLYFKSNRKRYYELLNTVRLTGEWEEWLDYFADAIIFTSNQAIETADQLIELSNRSREQIVNSNKVVAPTHKSYELLLKFPIINSSLLQTEIGLKPSTAVKVLNNLEQLGIIKEVTGYKRNRIFEFTEYLDVLNHGTELPE